MLPGILLYSTVALFVMFAPAHSGDGAANPAVGSPAVKSVNPAWGPTTGRDINNDPITVRLEGVNLHPSATVRFGGVQAEVVGVAPDFTYLDVYLPPAAPGVAAVMGQVLSVPVTVDVAGLGETEPVSFAYGVVCITAPCAPGNTIQDCIDAAMPGTCIVVPHGVYVETLVFDANVSQITLMGESPDSPEKTRIAGTPPNPTVHFDGTGDGVVLAGLTVSLGNGGILIQNASPLIILSRIDNNIASQRAGGITVAGVSAPVIQRNTITSNIGGTGGGIAVLADAAPAIYDNRIVSNTATTGGGIHIESSGTVTVWSNLIVSNSAGSGGGIYFAETAAGVVEANRIFDNQAGGGGGITSVSGLEPLVRSNLVAENGGSVGGGVLIGEFGLLRLEENVIKSNMAQNGAGIACLFKSEAWIYRNIIAFNGTETTVGPGILVGQPGDVIGPAPDIVNNTVYANGAPAGGSGVHGVNVGVSAPDWVNNIISDHAAWGIFCDGVNGGSRIEYNDLFNNVLGGFPTDCIDPSGPAFQGNVEFDPQFIDPSINGCNFVLGPSSLARGAAEDGDDLGAERPDATVDSGGGVVLDTGTPASVVFPVGVVENPTDVFLRMRHLPLGAVSPLPETLYIELLLRDGTLTGDVALNLPMRAPAVVELTIGLFRLDEPSGVFVDTGLRSTAAEGEFSVAFGGVSSPGTYVGVTGVGPPGDVDGDGVVGIIDFLAVLANWGPCTEIPCTGDTDGDGVVGIVDFLTVLANWTL